MRPDREPFWTLSRALSLEVAVGEIALAWYLSGGPIAFRFALGTVLPLACIWFPREMGRYRGAAMTFPVSLTEDSNSVCEPS